MPIIQIHLLEGRSTEQKRRLAAKVTEAVCEVLEKEPAAVRVILSEMAEEHYAIGGVLIKDGAPKR